MKDIVGDVHGHAEALEALLVRLGYTYRQGAWRHPERQMIFVGDLIDRGPQQLETIDIVRRMRDAGSAMIVCGNHELNAIGLATPDPGRPGHFFRIRGSKNLHQHRAFLDAVGEIDGPLHRELVSWFKTIPLWLDLPHLRVVHACWHPQSVAVLKPFLNDDATIPEALWDRMLTKGTALYEASEILLKGLEVPLPDGVSFRDKDGHERRNTRVRWWDEGARTFRAAALVDAETSADLPDTPLPDGFTVSPDGTKPVFFGHYWASGEPAISSPKRTCLDFSVAKGGYLACYRHDGEDVLDPSHLVWVGSNNNPAPMVPHR